MNSLVLTMVETKMKLYVTDTNSNTRELDNTKNN